MQPYRKPCPGFRSPLKCTPALDQVYPPGTDCIPPNAIPPRRGSPASDRNRAAPATGARTGPFECSPPPALTFRSPSNRKARESSRSGITRSVRDSSSGNTPSQVLLHQPEVQRPVRGLEEDVKEDPLPIGSPLCNVIGNSRRNHSRISRHHEQSASKPAKPHLGPVPSHRGYCPGSPHSYALNIRSDRP